MNVDNLISVLAIVTNDSPIIESYINDTIEVLKKNFSNFELLLVDNGSTDDSVAKIKALQSKTEHIRLLILSKEYHEETAYIAAFSNSIGDFVVLMDVNDDPPSLIPELVEKSISGYDVVAGENKEQGERKGILEQLFTKAFFKMAKYLTDYNVDTNLSKYTVFSRKAVNSILKIKDRCRYLKFLMLEVGFSLATIPFQTINRRTYKKKESLFASLGFAVEVIVSNSDRLIRIASLVGLMASLLNLLFGIYALFAFIFFRSNVPAGWTSTQIISSTMFFLLFLILAITGEYIARILKETKRSERYHIADESNSSVFPGDVERKNVLQE